MQDEHISNLPAAATPYPSQQQASKLISSKFVPETRVQRASSAKHRPDEKIIYRNVNLFDMNEKTLDRCSTCSRSSSRNFDSNCCPNCHTVIKPVSRTMSRARGTPVQMSRGGGGGKPAKTNSNRFKQASQTDVDWNNLNDKIEDWFQVAKTPEQRIVYKFLKEIKDEKYEDESYAASVMGSLDENGQNVQSLEDILDNLKKYRHKFTKKNAASRAGSRGPPPPNASHNLPYIKSDLLTHYPDNMDKAFESSTWRVMRHVKSADIRNRYPLPKANPDYHFGNSSVFFTAGRAPKSTFLLHPDWV